MKNRDRHHPVRQTMSPVLARGRGSRLHALTERHVEPAAPFPRGPRFTGFVWWNPLNSNLRPRHPGPDSVMRVTAAMAEVVHEALA